MFGRVLNTSLLLTLISAWGYKKSLKGDPLFAEDFIKATDVTGRPKLRKNMSANKLFSSHYCMKAYLIFKLYLSQIIDQNQYLTRTNYLQRF